MTGHVDYSQQLSPNAVTPEEWLQPAARLTGYLNKLSERTDLFATVGPGVGLGNPACFLPWKAEIRVDTTVCLPDVAPDEINPSDKLWRLEHPVFIGAAGHESAHASHTRWTFEQMKNWTTPKELDVIMLLEEPRCEKRLLSRATGQRLFLRNTALELILKDFEIPETNYGAAAACALIMARVEGGTLEKKDGLATHEKVVDLLREKYNQLEELWKQFLAIGDNNYPSMVSVAKQWLRVLEEDPNSSDGLLINLQPQLEGEGSNLKPQVEGSGNGQAKGEVDTGWLKSAIGSASVAVEGVIIEARAGERARREMAAGAADTERREKAEKMANDAFTHLADDSTAPPVAGWRGERDPTDAERRAATELSERLMKAEQNEVPDIGRSTRVRPPGRMRSREAAQAAAYKELGLHGRPELFRARQLAPDVRSPLSIALMLDISGSMEKAERAISSTHWVVSHAGHRIGARTVAVHFGAKVHGVARVGQLHERVQEYDATDPWENFSDGFLATDHELTLLDGKGARLLVIASDGQYRKEIQQKFAEAAMTLCKQKGVAVIWLQLTRKFVGNYGYGTVLDMQDREPVDIAVAVGNAAVAQMERLK